MKGSALLAAVLPLLMAAPATRAQQEPDHAGGFLLADAQRLWLRDTPLNADNFEQIAGRRLDLAALLEGRTVDVSWRVRAEAARTGGPGQERHSALRLQELNRVFVLGEQTTLSLGKRIYSLDQAYANEPLGFFQKRTDLADPTDSLANSEGLPMALLSWVGARASAAAVYSKDARRRADGFNRGLEQAVLKFGYEFDGLSSALILRRASGESNGVGATVSGAAGEALSYYGSFYQARGTQRPVLPALLGAGAADGVQGVQALSSYRSNDGVRYPRATAGVVVSGRDLPRLQLEYAYDRRGLSDAQYERFTTLVDDIDARGDGAPLGKAQLAVASQMLLAQGMRRHYLDANLSYTVARWDLSGGVYAGVADWSCTWYASAQYQVSAHVMAALSAVAQSGPARSERALAPLSASLAARLWYRF